MTATIHEAKTGTEVRTADVPIIFAPVNDESVLAISRRLHDLKCSQRSSCTNRDWHSLQGYETTVRNLLAVMVDAQAAGEL